jgi:integrase
MNAVGKFADILAPKFADAPKAQEREEGTLAWFIERQFKLGKVLANSQRWLRQRIQRHPIGAMKPEDIRKAHLEEYARELLSGKHAHNGKPVKPQTAKQYIISIAAVVRYFVERDEIKPEAEVIYRGAIKFLKREKVIGDSQPRRRRPNSAENSWLSQYFMDREIRHNAEYGRENTYKTIPMTIMQTWQLASAMRVGNSCAILWEDWDRENHTILVRKIKGQLHPKLVALTDHAQAILEALHPLRDQSKPRIFPYRGASVSAAYTRAKKDLAELGFHIRDLRLHDSRRDRGTRLVEEDGFNSDEAILFTGHATTDEFRRTYLVIDASKVAKEGPASRRHPR